MPRRMERYFTSALPTARTTWPLAGEQVHPVERSGKKAADDEEADGKAEGNHEAGPESRGVCERDVAEGGVTVHGLRQERGADDEEGHRFAAYREAAAGTAHLRVGVQAYRKRDGHEDDHRPKHLCHGMSSSGRASWRLHQDSTGRGGWFDGEDGSAHRSQIHPTL